MNLLIDVCLDTLLSKLDKKTKRTKDKECALLDFSLFELLEVIGDGNCQYTKKPFDSMDDVSFERVNPNLGYVRGNVITVKSAVNQSKGNLDAFAKSRIFTTEQKIKLMRKALYQLEKELKNSLA